MSETPGIRPDFMLYELHVIPSSMNSPAVPAVALYSSDLGDPSRRVGNLTKLTPAQAREYARRILAAADEAEGKR